MSSDSILLFGSFDGLHPGHRFLIRYALSKGTVTVALASDATIYNLKGRNPQHSYQSRSAHINAAFPKVKIIPSDQENNSWGIFNYINPDIVIVGHDQGELQKALQKPSKFHNFSLTKAPAFRPEKYKSSLLRKST